MQIKESMYGFKLSRTRQIPELYATLHEMEHVKSGAKLVFIERDDDNMTFAISFKTIPEDDTGVFHILEHSVLCGSRKFPVKEPFVDLLKSSLKTFLNAMTFPDKTMYPVSSRSERDFLNLVDVYMDAVLHPMALENPYIFYQEGWHYEMHPGDEKMSYKGVVFNEMKGAYSSVDDVEMAYMSRLLYRGTPYSHDSGGNPEAIPNLSYEQFVSAHKKFYHPENSTVILDGRVNLDAVLPLLDEYFSEYEREGICFDIPALVPQGHIRAQEYYEPAPGEEEKVRISLGFSTFSYDRRGELLALSIAMSAICGSNDTAFKRAMLDSGLCEDVYFVPYDGIRDSALTINIKNVRRENVDAAVRLAYDTLGRILNEGIDKQTLRATIARKEFNMREQDAGNNPIGIDYAISVMEALLYGGDAYDALAFEGALSFVKAGLDIPGFFEELLRRVILKSEHSVQLYLYPDATLGDKRGARECERLAAALNKMDAEQRAKIIAETERTEEWQQSEDSEENRAKLPKLSVADIPKKPIDLPIKVSKIGDIPLVFTPIKSRGISYLRLAFDITDFTGEELFASTLLTCLYKDVDTELYSASELQNKLKLTFGSFSALTVREHNQEGPKVYFNVTASMLDAAKAEACELISEVLLRSKFTDTAAMAKIFLQMKIAMKESFATDGHLLSLNRASSYVSCDFAIGEYISGVEAYRLMCECEENYRKNPQATENMLRELVRRIFTKARLTVGYGAAELDELPTLASGLFPDGNEKPSKTPIQPFGKLNEGFIIPAQISYAALSGSYGENARHHGSLAVIRNILSYDYLWNQIRVMGGAYGAGLVVRDGGILAFYSYRDPSAGRSIDVYKRSAEHLRTLAESGAELTDYIIGAIGDTDPIATPKLIAAMAFKSYLRGEDDKVRYDVRAERINTSGEDLLRAAQILEKIAQENAVCAIGARDILTVAEDKFTTLKDIGALS